MKLFAVVSLLFSSATFAGSASGRQTNRIWITDVTIISPENPGNCGRVRQHRYHLGPPQSDLPQPSGGQRRQLERC
jgi:hypothetical protein